MADVIMPQMGESIAEGTVTKWLKNLGDRIERDEPLFEISTDKVDAEIPSPVAGVLREIRVPPGTTVPVNTVVGLIEEEGEAKSAAEAPAAEAAPPAPEPAPPPAPAASPPPAPEPTPPPAPAAESAPEPAIALPPPSEPPSPSAPPAAASPPTPPPAARPVPEPPPTPDQQVLPYVPPVDFQLEDDRPSDPPVFNLEKPKAEMTPDELRQARSSPVVRKIAAEHKVDLSQVSGTGIGGRVTKQDILGHVEGQQAAPTPAAPAPVPPAAPVPTPPAAAAPAPPPAPAAPSPPPPTPAAPLAPGGPRVELVPMSPIRKKTAEHMVLSKRTSAHVSTVFEIDMTRVDHLRRTHRQAWEQRTGVKLTFMPFILKAVVDGLKAFPILNARVDGDRIAYHRDINLGVAVALEWGLIVPVIRNADEKNLLGLARAVNDLAERARAKKLKVDEVQGGTFTITNPGVFGSLFGTPIINQPQVAILDIGTIEKRPVVRDDAIAIRTMAYFSLTFDHRLVDGSDADRFMAHIKATLQEFDEAAV